MAAVSTRIARAVGRCARDEGLTEKMDDAEIDARIETKRWLPVYTDIIAAQAARRARYI